MSNFEALQSRQKGKVHTWKSTQENNHTYMPVALAYVPTQRMWILKPCIYVRLGFKYASANMT